MAVERSPVEACASASSPLNLVPWTGHCHQHEPFSEPSQGKLSKVRKSSLHKKHVPTKTNPECLSSTSSSRRFCTAHWTLSGSVKVMTLLDQRTHGFLQDFRLSKLPLFNTASVGSLGGSSSCSKMRSLRVTFVLMSLRALSPVFFLSGGSCRLSGLRGCLWRHFLYEPALSLHGMCKFYSTSKQPQRPKCLYYEEHAC